MTLLFAILLAQAAQHPCLDDAKKLCPGVEPGQCMQQHKDEVSPECRELFSRVAEQHGALGEAVRACRADAKTFCKDVKPGEGRMAECLKQHKAELSPDCAARLP